MVSAADGQNREVDENLRVAVTVEQCWHRVPGGTATSTLGFLGALATSGEVQPVGVAARHASPPPGPFVPPVPVRHLPLPRLALYETWHGLRWPKVERATGPVDVVHGTAVAVPASDAPLVMTIHDLAFLVDPTQATRHGNRFFRRGMELARRHAERVMVPSEATAAECREAGFDPEVLRVVPWGVDVASVTEADVAAARSSHGLERPFVLFVGTVEPRKNLAAVVGAMEVVASEHRDVDLVLVGPDGWNEDLAERLAPLDAAGVTVHRLGFVPMTELPALYAACAAFCFPSLREGFGLPVLEAMAHGAPVVTSIGTATAEVGGDLALLVDPRDHEAVGRALLRFLDDPALADERRRRGRQHAAAYTWEAAGSAIAAVYREVAR